MDFSSSLASMPILLEKKTENMCEKKSVSREHKQSEKAGSQERYARALSQITELLIPKCFARSIYGQSGFYVFSRLLSASSYASGVR